MYDDLIKFNAEKIFIKKDCDTSSIKVATAIAIAAEKMAGVECFIEPCFVYYELKRVYGIDGFKCRDLTDREVYDLIGYNLNFSNMAEAVIFYRREKDSLEYLFLLLKENLRARKRLKLIKKYNEYLFQEGKI